MSPNYITHLYLELICKQRRDPISARLPLLWLIMSKPAPVSWSRTFTLCLQKDKTCLILNENLGLGAFKRNLMLYEKKLIQRLLHSSQKTHLNSFCTCGVQFCFITIFFSTPNSLSSLSSPLPTVLKVEHLGLFSIVFTFLYVFYLTEALLVRLIHWSVWSCPPCRLCPDKKW